MDDDYNGGSGPRRSGRGARRSGSGSRYDDEGEPGGESYDESYESEDEPRRSRPSRDASRRPAPPSRRSAPRKTRSSWSFFGPAPKRRKVQSRDEGMDWDGAQEEYEPADNDEAAYDRGQVEADDERPQRRGGPRSRGKRRRPTLMDLATPVFGYAAILPREAGGIHPGYQQFRQEVLTALQKILDKAPDCGVDPDDAEEARFALCLLIDEQVAESEWSGKSQWATEPLGIGLLNDAEGGIHFFEHLAELGERQKAVKEVFMVCLAFGFRGQFAELDATQQASRIGEIRQRLLRSVHPIPLDKKEVLFPEAYEQAAPIEDEAPPPSKLYIGVSLGIVAAAVVIWALLFWAAGRIPDPASETLQKLAEGPRPLRTSTPASAIDLGPRTGAAAPVACGSRPELTTPERERRDPVRDTRSGEEAEARA